MTGYILGRLVGAIPLLFLITVLSFGILHLAPGDPSEMFLRPGASEQDRQRIRANLGLDRPLPVQYLAWVGGVLRGDLGYSLMNGRPVGEVLGERLPATLLLTGTALAASLLVALPVAVLGAVKPGSWGDRLAGALAVAGISLPSFWLALMALSLFCHRLGWFPAVGMSSLAEGSLWDQILDGTAHLVLPAGILALRQAGAWSRYLRASLREVLAQDYIQVARARGLPAARILSHHAVRNALGPLLVLLGLSLPDLFSGAFVVEYLFGWPGMGNLGVEAIFHRDYPVLMGDILMTAALVVAGNLMADLALAWVDPRVRVGEKAR